MSRAFQLFRQGDLVKIIKAMVAAGLQVHRVELDAISGKIIVMTSAGTDKEPTTDLDKWIARHAD
jgi:hypothetical protein